MSKKINRIILITTLFFSSFAFGQYSENPRWIKTMEIPDYENAETLHNGAAFIKSLPQMESLKLRTYVLEKTPWSTSYWPIAKGQIANRYADPAYPKSKDWQQNYSSFVSSPTSSLISAGRYHHLSPAEKYDFLVGDYNFTLTQSMWRKVQNYASTNGVIPSWAGICHGWAPASLVYDEPVRSVTLTAANGASIKFNPTDIKALASQLWAEESKVNFIGKKCKVSSPARNSIGEVDKQECEDINPGTWHLAVVNSIGVLKQGFIMDATYDYEIWNHPVYGYEYSYFNPQTLEPTNFWKKALTNIGSLTVDKFKNYRAKNAAYLVGVIMNVRYMVETNPNSSEGSSKMAKVIRYVYDLELDSSMNIVGGEWYTTMHPDWIWIPKSPHPTTGNPNLTSTWSGRGPLPTEWIQAAPRYSSRSEPLAAIVETLISLSK
ncbi:MAG: hypothetical protein IPM57_08665 [Oligoflexia bacterium]|nr:hypothetical protein [Oligoflexia bacterium]